MMTQSSEGAILILNDEIVSILCKLQSLLAVSVTVPVYINSENLKWRTDLQSKTPKLIEKVKKTDVQDMHPFGIVIIHDSLPSCTVAAMEDSTWSI